MSRPLERHARHPRGRAQGLVEFALVLPVFMLVVFGLIDGGRLVFAYNEVSQSARAAARAAAVEATFIAASPCTRGANADGTSGCPSTTAIYRAHVLAAANRTSIMVGTITNAELAVGCSAIGATNTTNDCDSANVSGNVVTVRLVVTIEPLTPFWGPFYPSSVSAISTMVLP